MQLCNTFPRTNALHYSSNDNGPYTICVYAFKMSYQMLVSKTYDWSIRCIMLNICSKTIHDTGVNLSTVNLEIENCAHGNA